MKKAKIAFSPDMSRTSQAAYLIGALSVGLLIPMAGLRALVMQHHMICEDLCRDDPDMICPVDLDLTSVFAFEVFWLPGVLSICAVLMVAILIKKKSAIEIIPPEMPESCTRSTVKPEVIDMPEDEAEDKADLGMPEFEGDVTQSRPQRGPSVEIVRAKPKKLQVNRYRLFPID
jgi:hypothetical protein